MQRPRKKTLTLNDILITEELSRRSPRPPNWQAQAQAMQPLARQMAQGSQSLLQTLADIALELCQAGTAGVSLLETTADGEEVFRWAVLAGTLGHHVGGSTPRNFSPCGVCLEYGTPVLFAHPERYFTYFQEANTPIVEGLVLPLMADNHALGTIWIMSHDSRRHFDSEDVRVMTSLADFTAAALLLKQQQTQELWVKNAQLAAEVSHRQQTEIVLRESEERTRALIENLPGGAAFVVDRDLCYLLAQGEALSAAGFKSEDFVGKTIFEVLPPELAAIYEVNYRRGLVGESFEHEHEAHDRFFISRGTPLRSADGEVYAVLVVSYDITDRKQAEAAIAADLRDTQLLQDLSARLVGETDIQVLDDEIVAAAIALTQADAGSFQFLDQTTQELVLIATQGIDRTLTEHFYRLDASSNTSCGIALATDERIFINFDVSQREDPDGSLRLHLQAGLLCAQSTPLITRSGKAIGMISTHWRKHHQPGDRELRFLDLLARQAADIIEQRQAEENRIQLIHEQAAREQERQRAETLAELDRAKTLFFSNVSHEFRTPLTLLLAPLQDALSDTAHPLPPTQQERVKLAQRNSLRLLKLVNTLLDFSRIEAGRMEAVYEPTNLTLYTTELASVFRSAIERVGLQLIVDCPPISELVYVDREMWEKIVLNLLSNAFKFTLEGEITIRLHLADDRHVKLQIEDTGIGIEAEELPHLFKRFYQVKKATARTHEGSGIGLALVQELIKMHGGTVEVCSTVGQGSCFTVTIPLGTAHLPTDCIQGTRTLMSTALGAAPYVQEAERWIGEEAGERNFFNAPCPILHILIVDDNADMRNYLTRILSEHHQVIAVADGAAALAAVNEQVPDLVLSDVMMPGLDGFELLHALRADARTKEVPIILLSARAGEESVIEGLQAGADDYLIKPFSATELVTRVNAYLQMAQMRSQALHSQRAINRRKDEVLSTVSHELNTPLVAILGWTRLLRSSQPSQAMLMKALETIERNATLQAKLVQDLLDISRITAGKISLNLEPVQLQGVIENAIATIRQCETKGIHLDCLLPPSPTIVQADPERLQQIILNLLTNAVKFTPEAGRIEVSLQTDENQAQIIVSDTGCGIDSEFLPYIFDTFRQAESTKKGLGLGLAIARSLVELHGGTIEAQSPGIGQGTTFIVTLPLILINS